MVEKAVAAATGKGGQGEEKRRGKDMPLSRKEGQNSPQRLSSTAWSAHTAGAEEAWSSGRSYPTVWVAALVPPLANPGSTPVPSHLFLLFAAYCSSLYAESTEKLTKQSQKA